MVLTHLKNWLSCVSLALVGIVSFGCNQQSKGLQIQIAHRWGGPEKEAFESILQQFEKEHPGIKTQIRNISSSEYNPWLLNQFAANVAPDLFVTSSPGMMKEFLEAGKIDDLSSHWEEWKLQGWYSNQWNPLIVSNSKVMGLPFKSSAKGLIWYSPQQFKSWGIDAQPKSWSEFVSLLNTLKSKSITPVILGGKDSWPITDWFEQIFLRTQGLKAFQALASENLAWTNPEVINAFTTLKTFKENYFAEDPLALGFVEAVQGRIDGKAALQLQGGWVNLMTREYDTKLIPQKDYDFFPVPSEQSHQDGAQIIGGDFVVVSKGSLEKEGVKELINYLASATAQEIWVKRGGYIATNLEVNLEAYPDALAKKEAQTIREAKTLIFDLDDQMTARMQRLFWEKLQSFIQKPDVPKITSEMQAALQNSN